MLTIISASFWKPECLLKYYFIETCICLVFLCYLSIQEQFPSKCFLPNSPLKNFFFKFFCPHDIHPVSCQKLIRSRILNHDPEIKFCFVLWYHLSSQLFHSYLLCSLLKDTTFSWKKSFKEKTICVSQPFSFLAWTSHLQSFLHIAIRLIRCSFSPQLLSGYFHFKSWLQLQQSQVELIVLVSQRYFPFISSFMFATTIFPVPQPRN